MRRTWVSTVHDRYFVVAGAVSINVKFVVSEALEQTHSIRSQNAIEMSRLDEKYSFKNIQRSQSRNS